MNIFPSIIANTQSEFEERLMKISFSDNVHIDVMDGLFVPNKSFLFDTHFDYVLLKQFKNVEMHIMAIDPLPWIELLQDTVQTYIIHVEIPHLDSVIAKIKSFGCNVSLAINPTTDLHKLNPYIHSIDMFTVMTVKPGFYGSTFVPQMVNRIKELKGIISSTIPIECDGSINDSTIISTSLAGASRFVVGSALQNAHNVQVEFEHLESILNSKQ